MLKKIDKEVGSSYILPLVVTYLLTTFIFVMQFLWKYIDDIVGKGLELALVLRLVLLFAIIIAPMALPLAVLLASNMVMGNLAESNELTAYKASGISLLRVMRSLIVIAVFMALFCYYYSDRILPNINLKFYALLYDIRKQKPALDIKEGIFYRGISNFAIKVKRKAADNQTLYDILVYDHSTGTGNDMVITAKKGIIRLSNTGQYLILTLFDGSQYQFQPKKNKTDYTKKELTIMQFKEWQKVFDLTEFKMQRTDENLFKSNYAMYNVKQLKFYSDSIQQEIKRGIINNTNTQIFAFKLFDKHNPPPALPQININKDSSISIKNILSRKITSNITQQALSNAEVSVSNQTSILEDIKWKTNNRNSYLIELYKKFSLSFACIVLMFIGAVMGAIVRKGGIGFPILISVLYFVAFHFLNVIGEKLAKNNIIPVPFGMWLATIVLFPLALFLTYKAINDSVIFRVELYQNIIKKILPIKK